MFLPMLNKEEVLKIARLARLELNETEVGLYQKHLTRVLDYIAELNQVPTPPDAFVKHIPTDATGLREDEPHPFSNTEALLANAPLKEGNSFLLPPVLEKE